MISTMKVFSYHEKEHILCHNLVFVIWEKPWEAKKKEMKTESKKIREAPLSPFIFNLFIMRTWYYLSLGVEEYVCYICVSLQKKFLCKKQKVKKKGYVTIEKICF